MITWTRSGHSNGPRAEGSKFQNLRIVRLDAEGSGAGHGVGMCQWGAIGRARAGFSYQDILSAYFPGTAVTRNY